MLQGIAICARCGNRLSVTYKEVCGKRYWSYVCSHIAKGEPYSHKQCLCISGVPVDRKVSEIILQVLTPEVVKESLEIQKELEKRKHSADNYFILQVEKAKYEANLARKRYLSADPENRLVSVELERLWDIQLKQLAHAESELRKQVNSSAPKWDGTDLGRFLEIPEQLAEVWQGNSIDMADKKRIIRCLVEDVTLNTLEDGIFIGIRFKGGKAESITIPRPLKKYEIWTTKPEIVEYVREASKKSTVEGIVRDLNEKGWKSGKGLAFTRSSVRAIQYSYEIPSLKSYLHSIGYLTTEEKAAQIGISVNALNKRRTKGSFESKMIKATSSGDYMYEA